MTQEAIVEAVKANESKKITLAAVTHAAIQIAPAAQGAAPAVQEVGELLTGSPVDKGLTLAEIQTALNQVHGETAEGKGDGTRVHLHYKAFGKPSLKAIQNAHRAEELGLPRDHMYRTLNLDKGKVFRFIVLGV